MRGYLYKKWKKWRHVIFISDMEQIVWNQSENFEFNSDEYSRKEKITVQEVITRTLLHMSEEDRQIWKLYRSGFQFDEIAVMTILPVDKINRRICAIRRDLQKQIRN